MLTRRRRRRPVAAVGLRLRLQRTRRTRGLVTAEPGRVLLGLEPEAGDAAGHDVARLGRPVVVHRVRRRGRAVRRSVLRRGRRQHGPGRRSGRVETVDRRLVVVMVNGAQRVHRPRERLRSQRARHLRDTHHIFSILINVQKYFELLHYYIIQAQIRRSNIISTLQNRGKHHRVGNTEIKYLLISEKLKSVKPYSVMKWKFPLALKYTRDETIIITRVRVGKTNPALSFLVTNEPSPKTRRHV